MSSRFSRFAAGASAAAGHYSAFLAALVIVIAWAIAGPVFHYSSTWQLVINTGTTIITFLMVFLVQSSQNRDSAALHVKLDEIIRALTNADDRIIIAEEDTDEALKYLKQKYSRLAGTNGDSGK